MESSWVDSSFLDNLKINDRPVIEMFTKEDTTNQNNTKDLDQVDTKCDNDQVKDDNETVEDEGGSDESDQSGEFFNISASEVPFGEKIS